MLPPAVNITVDLADVMRFNDSATSGKGALPLFKARTVDLFTKEAATHEFNITALDVPAHGSRMYRVSALPSGWIANTGTNLTSLVAGSCGYNPGNPAWKAVDGVIEFECGLHGWDACQVSGPAATTAQLALDKDRHYVPISTERAQRYIRP